MDGTQELSEEEEETEIGEIRKVLDGISASYAKYDSKAIAAMTHDPWVMMDRTVKGRPNVSRFWEDILGAWKTKKVVELDDFEITLLAPNAAIAKGRCEFVDAVDEEGNPLPPRQVAWANVFIKKDGRWRRACAFTQEESATA